MQKALVASPSGNISLRIIKRNRLKQGEALLKVRSTGICGTDLAIISGNYKITKPVVLGHEIVGEVEQIEGKLKDISIGSRVTTEINVSCGNCSRCRIGLGNHCLNIETIGITRDGGFAEYVSVPVENLHNIPDSISDEQAVFIEPLAAAIQLTKMTDVSARSNCAVVGVGRLGLLLLQILQLRSPRHLVAVTHNRLRDRRSELAASFGAKVVPSSTDLRTLIDRFTNRIGFDHVVEATGSPDGFDLALKIVRPRGTVDVKSTHGLPVNLNLTDISVREIRIQGSRCGPFDEAIKMIQDRKVSLEKMVSARFRLEDYKRAFPETRNKNFIKTILEISKGQIGY